MADREPSGKAPHTEPGTGPAMAAGDLDALIGEARREGSRRRAEPDFPIDEEAALAADMDRQGPRGPGVDVRAATEALQELARSARAGQPAVLADVAELAASALRGVAQRLADLERRVAGREPGDPAGSREP